MPLKMLGWKKRTPQCREARPEPRTPDPAMDAGSATSATSSDTSDGSGGLVRLTDILQAGRMQHVIQPLQPRAVSKLAEALPRQQLTLDERQDSRRKPLFREWTLKKSTSVVDDDGHPAPGPLQPGPSQDDLRAVEEQYRRGGDPSQVTQWLAAMRAKGPSPAPSPRPSRPERNSVEADRELARRPLGELTAMERQLQRLEAQQGMHLQVQAQVQGQVQGGASIVRRESERVAASARPQPRRPVTLSRTHSDSAPPDGPTPRVNRRWIKPKRSTSSSSSPQPSPAVVRRAPGQTFSYHIEVNHRGH